jgi:hypothetical protein
MGQECAYETYMGLSGHMFPLMKTADAVFIPTAYELLSGVACSPLAGRRGHERRMSVVGWVDMIRVE